MFSSTAIASESSYILPYPSAMPGSIFYKLNLIKEEVLKYWYFGDFGQLHFNLKQSDKYLVEAKTLFEYKQYLLGFQALKKSDRYFADTLPYLVKAQKQGKNIVQKQNLLREARLKHVDVINSIKKEVPKTFIWQPEKSPPTILNLGKEIENAKDIRRKVL